MRPTISALILILILNLSAMPALVANPVGVMITGIGRASCASWLATPASEAEGGAWILGFWTGHNYGGALSHGNGNVGSTTDALGIIGAMKKRCVDDPAAVLAVEVGKLYVEYQKAGK